MHRYSGNTVEEIRGDEIGGCSSKLQFEDALERIFRLSASSA